MTQHPRLVVRMIDAPNTPGSKVLALCTEDGQIFGMQTACTLTSEAEAFTTVTASFVIDGEAIRLG